MTIDFDERRRAAGRLTVLTLVALAAAPALAVDLRMEQRPAGEGAAKVCIILDASGQEVAGTQNDLAFDTGCARLEKTDCVASEHHGKPLHGSIPDSDPNTYRSLVFALDNVDPMLEGDIYCCTFELVGDGDACCEVTIGRLGSSDPEGNALDTRAPVESVCLTGEVVPAAAAAATGETSAPEGAGVPGWVWMAGFGALVIVVLFFALRRAE